MKVRITLVGLICVLTVGLLFAFTNVVKAAEGDPTYTGVLTAVTNTTWTLDTKVFTITPTTIMPPFFAISDTVVTTYTEGTAPDDLFAKEFKVLNSGVNNTYTYTGTLTTILTDTWTVGEHTFLMTGVTLPPLVKVNDIVEVTFKIVNGEYVATAVKVTETAVPPKVNSSRCENRIKNQPAVYKLASELKEDPKKITNYFCLGFGVGEIKLAYKTAANGYTPAMLLAMRASGMGWGEIKQMVANAPAVNTDTGSGSSVTNPSSGSTVNTVNTGKSNNGNGPDKNKSNHGKNK